MLGLVPRPVHGVLDYLWSVSLFAAPHLFGFSNDKRATLFCRVLAGSAFVMSLFTRYELGLVKVLPFNMHLAGDSLNAVAGLAGPSVMGFDKNDKARNTVLGFVLFEIGAVLLSKRDGK
ncbi:MAG TPA: hypothetical protein VF826_17550 [Chloroflexia bacterium]